MYSLINDFLILCIELGSIPIEYVKSTEFMDLCLESKIVKLPCYEELYYSRDEDLKISRNRSQARYFNENSGLFTDDSIGSKLLETKEDVDLSSGYKEFTILSRNSLTLDNVRGTKYVALENYERNQNKKVNAGIITSRHTLLDLLYLPFGSSRIVQNVVAFNGQVFMEAEQRLQGRADPSTMTGYNFEEVMTCTQSELKRRGSFQFKPPLNNAIKYNSMIMHTFPGSDFSALVSCEIDSIKQNPEEIKSCYTESEFKYKILENNIEMKSRRIDARSNLIKAILQCYLAGTNDLVIGYRDNNFNLKYVEKLSVSELFETSTKRLLNRVFLDSWFWLITQFISKTVQMPGNANLHHHQLIFNKTDNRIHLNSFRLNPYRLEKTIIKRFVKWRRFLLNSQKNQLQSNTNDDTSKKKTKPRRHKRKSGKSQNKTADYNKNSETNNNITEHIKNSLERLSLSTENKI